MTFLYTGFVYLSFVLVIYIGARFDKTWLCVMGIVFFCIYDPKPALTILTHGQTEISKKAGKINGTQNR